MAKKPIVMLLAILVLGAAGFAVASAGTRTVALASPAPDDSSCIEAAGTAAELTAAAKSPRPHPEAVCIIEICKLRGNHLSYCVVDASGSCCKYGQQQCQPVSSCPAGVPVYCDGSTPGGDPPDACNGTC